MYSLVVVHELNLTRAQYVYSTFPIVRGRRYTVQTYKAKYYNIHIVNLRIP